MALKFSCAQINQSKEKQKKEGGRKKEEERRKKKEVRSKREERWNDEYIRELAAGDLSD